MSSLHLLYINTRLLPPEIRPPLWRRAALVAMSLFYGAFVALWLWGGPGQEAARGLASHSAV